MSLLIHALGGSSQTTEDHPVLNIQKNAFFATNTNKPDHQFSKGPSQIQLSRPSWRLASNASISGQAVKAVHTMIQPRNLVSDSSRRISNKLCLSTTEKQHHLLLLIGIKGVSHVLHYCLPTAVDSITALNLDDYIAWSSNPYDKIGCSICICTHRNGWELRPPTCTSAHPKF